MILNRITSQHIGIGKWQSQVDNIPSEAKLDTLRKRGGLETRFHPPEFTNLTPASLELDDRSGDPRRGYRGGGDRGNCDDWRTLLVPSFGRPRVRHTADDGDRDEASGELHLG